MRQAGKEIIAFAKANGYDGAIPLGKWRGYDAYEPTFDGADEDSVVCVGPPLMILAKGDEIRMSTAEEAFAQIEESDE